MKHSWFSLDDLPISKGLFALALSSFLVLPFSFVLDFLFPKIVWMTLSLGDLLLLIIIMIGSVTLGFQILKKALKGDFGSDILAIVAIFTAIFLQEYIAATLVILMLSGGQALEELAVRKASFVLRALSARMPSIAHRKGASGIEDIEISDIQIGDLIVVYPHETCPVDGTIVEGYGSMDESYLTGEPYQISKAPGAAVLSGAINGESVLVLHAEKKAEDSRYAQIMRVMMDAEQKRPMMRRLGDQIGTVFAPLALIFAFGVWYITGDSLRFLSVLVVATPCPLLIAIPITIISAISLAARYGIIVKDPSILERLSTCRTAIFDKTGTLTYGKPVLTEIFTAEGLQTDTILQLTASLERYSKHPLALSIVSASDLRHLPSLEAEQVSEKPGQGLRGRVQDHEIMVTHRKKMMDTHPDMLSLLPETAAGLECVVLKDGHYAATFRFHDAPRPDGTSFISHLMPIHSFNKVMLVSGDRESEVRYLADILGIQETRSSQSPEQKVAIVRAETRLAPTLFMGDGINDAPALASATVGIAFGQHSAVTSEAAGAVILEHSLSKVDTLLHISIDMRRIVLQSAVGGVALSLIAMGFAAGGFITPVGGAIIQEIIDLLAIANSLRLAWKSSVYIDF